MNTINYLVLILPALVVVNGLTACPEPFIDISPCKCIADPNDNRKSGIECNGDEPVLELSKIFDILDANIGPKNKAFNTFYLNNTSIEEIPENLFKGLTFEEIIIENNRNLSKINENSFLGSEERLKHLHIKDSKLAVNSQNSSDIQLFDGLKNLEFLDFSSSECPPTNLLGDKCKCEPVPPSETREEVRPVSLAIVCSHVDSSDELFKVFDGLNTHLNGNERNLFRFQLKESNITELKENTFQGIVFSEIIIQDCEELIQINKHVFKGIEPFVNLLSIIDVDLKNESVVRDDVWHAISSLPNLVSLHLVNVFDEIPDKAFKSDGAHIQWRLKSFSHSGFETTITHGHRIKKMGRYAFYVLPNIQVIDLQSNLIERIDKYSFANKISSNKRLFIRLGRNKLNESSFDVGAFTGTQRPIKLQLGQLFIGCNREILYLDEKVFSPFLDKEGNILDMGCPFVMQCECHMKWLFDGPEFWKPKLITGSFGDVVIPCEVENEDGLEEMSIWDLTPHYFKCNPLTSYESEAYDTPLTNTTEETVDANAENEVQEFVADAIEVIV